MWSDCSFLFGLLFSITAQFLSDVKLIPVLLVLHQQAVNFHNRHIKSTDVLENANLRNELKVGLNNYKLWEVRAKEGHKLSLSKMSNLGRGRGIFQGYLMVAFFLQRKTVRYAMYASGCELKHFETQNTMVDLDWILNYNTLRKN